MILCLRTDQPVADVRICDDKGAVIAQRQWEAHRTLSRDLLKVCDELAREAGTSLRDIKGLIVYRGPGSFTGLRIGCTVANTIAYSNGVPIVGANEDDWLDKGLRRLVAGENDTAVMPDYGAPPRVTQPKK